MRVKYIFLVSILIGSSDQKKKDQQFEQGYKDVNGIKMYYEIRGDGDPLVLIHGGGSTIYTTYGRIIDDLAKDRKVIAVELQAHGHTSDRDAEESFEQDADDVSELLKKLNIEKADIMGFSNGATTAVQIAIRHPEQVNRLVAVAGLFKRDGAPAQFWEFMNSVTIKFMPTELKAAYIEINNDSARLQVMHDKDVRRMVSFKDVPDTLLISIKAPVLFVAGDADVCTPEHMVNMTRLIPGSKLAIIPGVHGECLGEITTLKGNETEFEIMPILNKFLQ